MVSGDFRHHQISNMKQLILYIIFLMSMVFSGYGEVSAASISKVTPHQQEQDAQLEDASNAAYRVCSSRPQRLLPSGNIHGNPSASSRLLIHRIRFLSSLLSVIEGAKEPFRQELPLSTLMSPASIMSFACGISSVSSSFYIL